MPLTPEERTKQIAEWDEEIKKAKAEELQKKINAFRRLRGELLGDPVT